MAESNEGDGGNVPTLGEHQLEHTAQRSYCSLGFQLLVQTLTHLCLDFIIRKCMVCTCEISWVDMEMINSHGTCVPTRQVNCMFAWPLNKICYALIICHTLYSFLCLIFEDKISMYIVTPTRTNLHARLNCVHDM